VDVFGEVGADGGGGYGDAGGPLFDQGGDVLLASLAAGVEVEEELFAFAWREREVGADGPDGGNPGELGVGMPEVGDVVPDEGTGVGFDLVAVFESQQRGIADEESGVVCAKHGDGVSGCGFKRRGVVVEVLEEKLGIGCGAAGGGVGGDGADLVEGTLCEELDGAHAGERGDGAAGDDEEVRGEGGNGDEAEVSLTGEQLAGTGGGLGEVELVALGEDEGVRRVVEVPHEGRGVEEVDGGYAERHKVSLRRMGGSGSLALPHFVSAETRCRNALQERVAYNPNSFLSVRRSFAFSA
jgi:hypothetical protein